MEKEKQKVLHNNKKKHKNIVGFHSLQHTFGSVTAQVIGHRISTIQGCFHIQAANEILRVVLVEVKSHLGHICTVLWPALAELISGGTVL